MQKSILSAVIFLPLICVAGQKQDSIPAPTYNPDTTANTKHLAYINNKKISYIATTGTMPVRDFEGNITAGIFYTYYHRNKTASTHRPIIFFFNGGYGSPSIWLHMGYAGPVVANLDKDGYPVQPYGVSRNPVSVLDIADLVYVDPVYTGYSRAINPRMGDKRFLGEAADVRYLSAWIKAFLDRYDRWLSPLFLVGESAGGRRVAGLAENLGILNVNVNGVVLLSSASLMDHYIGSTANHALLLPYYAEIAWHNGLLSKELQSLKVDVVKQQASEFLYKEFLPAALKIGFADSIERQQLISKIHYYTSLDESVIKDCNLDIDTGTFYRQAFQKGKKLYYPVKDNFCFNCYFRSSNFIADVTAAWYYQLVDGPYKSMPLKDLVNKAEDFAIKKYLSCSFNGSKFPKSRTAICIRCRGT